MSYHIGRILFVSTSYFRFERFYRKIIYWRNVSAFFFCGSFFYHLDGQLHKEFFDSEQKPMRTYCLWEDVQAQCFSIIKGKRTPLNFKIVFQLSSSNVEKLLSQSGIALKPEDIYGLYLNCQFDGKQLLCTTGTSLKIFTLDKQLDRVWDEMVRKFFRKNQVALEDA